jgi:hypothetical protein
LPRTDRLAVRFTGAVVVGLRVRGVAVVGLGVVFVGLAAGFAVGMTVLVVVAVDVAVTDGPLLGAVATVKP